jgi:NAD(P)-dependent dehydrogenase (short-subunit alcohol dehydrogenase family)
MTKWTATDIPDLGSRVVVVTGANSGLGFETALELARHGAFVVLACRDETRGESALEQIRSKVPDATLRLALFDLADLASVRKFADGFLAENDRLDVLVNNAGVMALPERRTTMDGFEMQFGINHLGHYALTGLLLPALLARPAARVVSVTSSAHRMGRIRFDDLQSAHRYRKWLVYGQSKLANVLFTFELDRRTREAPVDLVATVAHPGFAATHLQDNTSFSGFRLFAQSAAQGALPVLYAATAPNVGGGDFFGPDGFTGQRGYPTRVKAARAGRNAETARRLWGVSEELTGVAYDFGQVGSRTV